MRSWIGLPDAHAQTYSVLAPNLQGAEKALAARAAEIVIFTAATENVSVRRT